MQQLRVIPPGGKSRSCPIGVLTEIGIRGTKDVFFRLCFGLKGLPRGGGERKTVVIAKLHR